MQSRLCTPVNKISPQFVMKFASNNSNVCVMPRLQPLQISQTGVIQNFIPGQIAALLNAVDFLNDIQAMRGISLPFPAQRSTASRSTFAHMWRFNSCSGTTSGRRPVIDQKIDITLGPFFSRATEPNTRMRRAPNWRHAAWMASF